MAVDNNIGSSDDLARRRVPCVAVFLSPFRLVYGPDSEPWRVTIQDVNSRRWDYVKLHELVGGVDIGLEAPYHLALGYDGALALPPLKQFQNHQVAVEFFNRCLAWFLVGGIYCTAVTLDDICVGSIIDWKHIRVHPTGSSLASRFHHLVRLRAASAYEAIDLMEPRAETVAALSDAIAAGRKILSAIPKLSGEFLLKGTTGIARRDWGTAHANLWIVVEQITSSLWERHVMTPAGTDEPVPGRLDQLSDGRSWTIAARQEMLYQLGVIPAPILAKLFVARKARNALAHTGAHPKPESTHALYNAVLGLIEIAAPGFKLPLRDIDLASHAVSDPFAPPQRREGFEPVYWMEIPKLPGEAELEKQEASVRQKRSTSN